MRRLVAEVRPDDGALADWYAGYADTHLQRLAFDLDLVTRSVAADARLLEVGSVPPLLGGALRRSGYDVQGIDLAPERFAAAIAALELPVARCDIEREPLPFAESTFDAVVFFEIFEHLRINPIFTLGEIHRVVRPQGRLLLSTPNLRSFNGLFNFVVRNKAYSCTSDVYAQYEKLERLGHMGHVREYTSREVCEFLHKIGFTARRIVFRGSYEGAIRRAATAVFPSLRPFMTVLAEKG